MAWVMDERETSTRIALKDGDVLGREGTHPFPNMVMMSRQHCKIFIEGELCYVMDLGSKNGTMVDGKKCDPNVKVQLRDGAVLSFGDKVVRVKRADKTQTQQIPTLMLDDPKEPMHLKLNKPGASPQISKTHQFSFNGGIGELMKLVITNLFLTILTLGIYIPYARTNMRKYIWKSSSLDKKPFLFKGIASKLLKGYFIVFAAYLVYAGITFVTLEILFKDSKSAEIIYRMVSYLVFLILILRIKFNTYAYLVNHTSYRAITFRVKKEAGKKYFHTALKSIPFFIITLGLYYPFWAVKAELIKWKNTHYGNIPLDLKLNSGEYAKRWYTGFFLTVLTAGFYLPWFMVSMHRYHIEHLKFMNARFQTRATGMGLFLVMLKSFFLVVITLGTALPYVNNLHLAFFLNNLSLKGAIDFEQIIQSMVKMSDDSLFDSAADIMDLEGLEVI